MFAYSQKSLGEISLDDFDKLYDDHGEEIPDEVLAKVIKNYEVGFEEEDETSSIIIKVISESAFD